MNSKQLIVERSLDTVLYVVSHCDDNVKRSFRARARQEPSNIAFNGFPLTIAVIAAHSSATALEEVLKGVGLEEFVLKVCSTKDLDYVKKLGVEGDEDKAYAIYGFALLHILKSLGYIDQKTFADVIRSVTASSPIGSIALQIATWIKRFAEAYIPKKS